MKTKINTQRYIFQDNYHNFGFEMTISTIMCVKCTDVIIIQLFEVQNDVAQFEYVYIFTVVFVWCLDFNAILRCCILNKIKF